MLKKILCLLSLSSVVYAQDPKLFTPGPLTTTHSVKQAMLHDYGSRDQNFLAINNEVMKTLSDLAKVSDTHVTVPVQGSGTFAVEAMLGSLLGSEHKVLLLVNGNYGKRMAEICRRLNKPFEVYQVDEDKTFDLKILEQKLNQDPNITHVAVVYCETTTGILNPVPQIAKLAKAHNKELLIDAMSAFGGIDIPTMPYAALAASSNKCLQGVPGMAFCIVRKDLLAQQGYSSSLSLDLQAQHQHFDKTGQWRFTPPTHVILALHQALKELKQEGGIVKREQRYAQNCQTLHQALSKQGFKRLLPDALQSNIIMTYYVPEDPHFRFEDFYQRLHAQNIVIYPGKLTQVNTFRLGCIGDLHQNDMQHASRAISSVLAQMGVSSGLG